VTLRWNLRVAMAERGIFTMAELGRRMADRGNYPLTPGLALDPHGQGVAGKAVLAWLEGRHEDALTHFRAFWSDGRERGDVQAMAYGLAALADYMLQLGRAFDAEAPAREAGAVIRSSWPSIAGFIAPIAEALVCLEAPDAEQVLSDAEQFVEQTGKAVAGPQLMRARGMLVRQHCDLSGAIEMLEASAALARSQQARIEVGRTLTVLADAAQMRGDRGLAGRADLERATIVDQIGPEVRGLAWARDFTVDNPARKRTRSGSRRTTMPLSPREREVAALIARRLTDRQIADQLVVTEGTAGVHVTHILNKLGYHTRAEIANWAVQHGLGPISTSWASRVASRRRGSHARLWFTHGADGATAMLPPPGSRLSRAPRSSI
jgi:DNA-binding CsgD family transcriptional regulator